jgi:hypothetical protein
VASGIVVKGERECIMALHRFRDEVSDGRKPFRLFFHDWALERRQKWNTIKANGGTFFGKVWDGMKPQYVRKYDGAMVPAWGGTPKVRYKSGAHTQIKWKKNGQLASHRKLVGDTATVQPKKRPSGAPVKLNSIMMRDTGQMSNAVLGSPESVEARRMVVSTKDITYAEEQEKNRNFMHWLFPQDEDRAVKWFRLHADEEAKRFNDGR